MAADKMLKMCFWYRFTCKQYTNSPSVAEFRSAAFLQTKLCQFWSTKFNEKITVLRKLFTKQCNAIAAQRVIRMSQILKLYRELYGDKSYFKLLDRLGRDFLGNAKIRPIGLLLGTTIFSWEKEKITDKDLCRCIDDMEEVCHVEDQHTASISYMKSWEIVIDREHLKLWRRPVSGDCSYEYKVYGTFYDITPRAFFNVQVDLDYRKQWDKLVIKLEFVDRDTDSDSEVVHWVIHFPYPMYGRDYVYVRRNKVDQERNVMVLTSRAVEHPACPEDSQYVRVGVYSSQMVIRPHKSFDENGFDYVLTYHDNPRSSFPSLAYNWMASTGVPNFVDKLHIAAKTLHEQPNKRPSSRSAEQQEPYNPLSKQYV